MAEELQGKVIVVIGGTTGLGLSAAKAVVRAGGAVVVVGRSAESMALACAALDGLVPGRARGLVGDAMDPVTGDRAVAVALEVFGGFDGLYHVAGGSGRRFGDGPLHEVTDAGVGTTLELNLSSLIYSNRAAVRSFLARGVGGTVLNMGSVLGSSPSPHYFSTHVYAAAKSAVIGFTKSTASCYASRDIRFNVIAPALVETPMAKRAAGDDEIREFIRTKQPLDGGRIGIPEDLDGLVVFFLSDQSRFVTGQIVAVDGGWTVSEGQVPETS